MRNVIWRDAVDSLPGHIICNWLDERRRLDSLRIMPESQIKSNMLALRMVGTSCRAWAQAISHVKMIYHNKFILPYLAANTWRVWERARAVIRMADSGAQSGKQTATESRCARCLYSTVCSVPSEHSKKRKLHSNITIIFNLFCQYFYLAYYGMYVWFVLLNVNVCWTQNVSWHSAKPTNQAKLFKLKNFHSRRMIWFRVDFEAFAVSSAVDRIWDHSLHRTRRKIVYVNCRHWCRFMNTNHSCVTR